MSVGKPPIEVIELKDDKVETIDLNKKKEWYIICCVNRQEARTLKNIQIRLENAKLSNLVGRFVIPEVDVPKLDKDKKPLESGETEKKNIYPGNIYVEMIMTDKVWYEIRNTDGVTGFIGSSGKGAKPFPVSRSAVANVLKRMGEYSDDMFKGFDVGESVICVAGPYKDNVGTITKAPNRETKEVEVEFFFFGKPTKMVVQFSDLELTSKK